MVGRLRYLANLLIFTLSLGALIVVAAPSDQLQDFNLKIEQARSHGAARFAPMSLRLAENELSRTYKMFRSPTSRPLSLEHTLEIVAYRVEELSLVLATRRKAGFAITEEAAVRQVRESHPEMSPMISKHEAVD